MTLLGLSAEIEDAVAESARLAGPAIAGSDTSDFRAQWRVLAQLDVLRAAPGCLPGPVTSAVAAIEGIGTAGASAGLCYAMASQRFGIQFPLRSVLPEATWQSLGDVEGGEVLLCHALTEEGGGSDPLSMTTRADRQPDGSYLLTGRKAFVTAAPVADIALVFARTTPGRSPFALSPFLVDLHAPNVKRSAPFAKTAVVDVPMGALDFTGVRLPPERLIGGEGSGLAMLATTTSWERALLLAYALGPMRRVLDRTVDWCSTREHFGRRMGASHLVAARVADMALALFRSRRLVYGLAERLDACTSPRQLATDAALTKISVAEDYVTFTRHAAVLGGVRSYIADSGLAADLISPMAASTYAGPNDLLRISVARELGLPVEN
jgi:alkylation response protein AidB-like acyl-CoA dehydrogenase